MEQQEEREYLECEKLSTFLLLIMSCGVMGAYTYVLKGGVFCNAQTGNILLFGIALGQMQRAKAVYLLIPITAYFSGAVVSEILPVYVRRTGLLRWDTLLIGIEFVVLVLLGFLPESTPVQVFQVTINFICSMQYNTFRQAQGIPMATTFCTNHLRQAGIHLAKWLRKKDVAARMRLLRHLGMIGAFVLGSFSGTVLCHCIGSRAVWGAAFLQLIVFVDLFLADLTKEKDKLCQVPSGH
jgi:uncharacterized membrane protein YoaK (UPF0700 family)